MAKVTFQGNPFSTNGNILVNGDAIPAFTLVKTDLSELTENDLKGKKTILNIYPSIDTGVCAQSVQDFNDKASSIGNVQIIGISKDLPFALGRFEKEKSITNVTMTSAFRSDIGDKLGITLQEKPLTDILSRALVVVDENLKVIHSELVSEITTLPNYDKAIAAVS